MQTNHKLAKILTTRRDVLDRTGRELAMNFDIPARDIIAMACGELGITRKQWDQLKAMQLEAEEVTAI